MNENANASEVPDIARGDEYDGQDMMREHLPMVFPSLLAMYHEDLVTPPTELSEVIEFGECGKEYGRICTPELFGRGKVGYPVHNNLQDSIRAKVDEYIFTHHAYRPKHQTVAKTPSLFCETRSRMFP